VVQDYQSIQNPKLHLDFSWAKSTVPLWM